MSTYVAVFAMVLAYVALVAAYLALRTLAKVRRATTILSRGARGPKGRDSLLEATARYAQQSELLAEQMSELRAYVDATCTQTLVTAAAAIGSPDISDAVRNVALVRYDAFPDVSGRMSFSLALLDQQGNGVTITAIAGSTDTSVYAKAVADGKGRHELSPEEQEAVASALRKHRGGVLSRQAG
jgi:Asp-tRNA(Asn)/Glu-tRNA(Gln) amidotransferase A subunit family amidase